MSIVKSFILGALLGLCSLTAAHASYSGPGISKADAKAYAKIGQYVLEAEQKSGTSADLLTAVLYIESNFGNNVHNKYSSVKGAMQYSDRQWRNDLKKHASKMGVSAKSSVHNKRANILVGAAGLAENRKYLESKVHRPVSDGDVYMSWFVGLYGAEKILKGKPNAKVSKYVRISRGNGSMFSVNGKVATVAQFRAKMNAKIKHNKQQTADLVNHSKYEQLVKQLQSGEYEQVSTAMLR